MCKIQNSKLEKQGIKLGQDLLGYQVKSLVLMKLVEGGSSAIFKDLSQGTTKPDSSQMPVSTQCGNH